MYKSIIVTSLLGLFLLVSLTGQSANAPALINSANLRYRIQLPANASQFQIRNITKLLMTHDFDVAGVNRRTNAVDVITNAQGVDFLKAHGLPGVVIPRSDFTPDKKFLNPISLAAKLADLSKINPAITRVVELGKSNQGRSVLGMLISSTPDVNDPRYHAKPTIIFDGLHHAREIMTPEIVVDVAETILKNPQDPNVQNIVNNWNVWLVPMVNPDGSNIVWTSNNMWRKNARADQSDIYGVDINRNYGYRWGECDGSSSSKYSDTYRGVSANSEPETQAMEKLADIVRPVASLSYHSYSEFVLYPLGCDGEFTAENALVKKIGDEMAALLPTDEGRDTYRPGTPWQLLYAVDGASMDYFYAAYGTLAYVFEVNEDFQPSYSIRDATVAKHRKAWMYFIARAQKNMLAVDVVDGKTGKASTAVVAINTINHTKKELPFRTNKIGRFFKVLDPGQYTISAKLEDGRTGQVTVTMNGQSQMAKIVVQ